MRKIIVGFSRPKKFLKPFSWAIRLIERTPYSHVYIRSRSENLGVDIVYQASGLQVNFMGLQRFRDHAVTLAEFEFEMPDEMYKNFMRWAITNSGADYSMKQPLGILLIKLFNLRDNPFANGRSAWVCSELVGFVFDAFLGVKIDPKVLDIIGPKGIFKLCEEHGRRIGGENVV
jgi:hypothetical protein